MRATASGMMPSRRCNTPTQPPSAALRGSAEMCIRDSLMMAGAQLQNCTLQDAEHRIREQIDLYRAAQKENTAR